jgi:hypothetical protein
MKASSSFSTTLKNISIPSKGISLERFLQDLGERGILVGLAFLTIPFLFGVSIPGTSAPFGVLICLVSWQLLFRRAIWIPKNIGRIHLSCSAVEKVKSKSLPWIVRLEAKIKPRWEICFKASIIRQLHVFIMMISGILLTAPIPIPLTNTFPAYAVLLLSIGILERDGMLVAVGHAFFVMSLFYFGLIGWIGTEGVIALWTSFF